METSRVLPGPASPFLQAQQLLQLCAAAKYICKQPLAQLQNSHNGPLRLIVIYISHCLYIYLSLQGFRKTDPDRWEFSNDSFVKGQKDQLKDITRRKATAGGGHGELAVSQNQPAIEASRVHHTCLLELIGCLSQ